jgi:DNA-binding Lrp family transcriptional regulator
MSATATASADTPNLTEKQREILSYLRENSDTQTYFKSRLIGEELGLSAKEVGTNMTALEEQDVGLDVEKWGYSSSTTWKVTGS